MIVAIGRARAADGRRDDLVAAAAAVVAATQDDDGCELYRFAADVTDPEVVLSVEIWRDQESLDAHLRHEHTAAFLSEVGDLVAGMPTMSFFTAERTPS